MLKVDIHLTGSGATSQFDQKDHGQADDQMLFGLSVGNFSEHWILGLGEVHQTHLKSEDL